MPHTTLGPSKNHCALILRLVPFMVFAFYVLSFSLHPQSPVYTQQLFNTDDYMRLNQTINWLNSPHPFGEGWYDLSQPRLAPGDNTIRHWSRLMDLPIAAVMLPMIKPLGMQQAAFVASLIVPAILFAVLLFTLGFTARPFTGKKIAPLAAAMPLFMPWVMIDFSPGSVHHHAYQITAALFGVGALIRAVLYPRGWKAGIYAAILFAITLWNGTEALPWALLFTAGIAAMAAWRGGFALRNAAIFGAALIAFVGIVTLLAVPPAEYSSRTMEWFSMSDFIMAALIGAGLSGGYFITRKIRSRAVRLEVFAGLGAIAGGLFLILNPEFAAPFRNYDTYFAGLSLPNIGQAQPFLSTLHRSEGEFFPYFYASLICLQTIFLPCLALLIVCWKIVRVQSERTRIVWLSNALFLIPAIILTLFWETRVGWFAEIFSAAPIVWLIAQIWQKSELRFTGAIRIAAQLATFIIIIMLPQFILPNAVARSALYPEVVFFPAFRNPPLCPLLRASAFLDAHYGDHPRVIMAGANEGPELLFRTPHEVLAAPYDIDANRDVFKFFNARDEEAAMEVLLRRNVDLVLVCRQFSLFYADKGDYLDKAAQDRVAKNPGDPTLIELLTSNMIPNWLVPVEIPDDPDYLLFEVEK